MTRKKRDRAKLPDPVSYSLWLLNYRGRSEKQMKEALLKRGFDEETASETIEKLLRWGYLNDETFKKEWIERRKRNNVKGRETVKRELREAGIDCGEELAELYSDEEERALIGKLVASWQRGGKSVSEERNRFFGRLYRRGFNSTNIRFVLDEIAGAEESEGVFEEDFFPGFDDGSFGEE